MTSDPKDLIQVLKLKLKDQHKHISPQVYFPREKGPNFLQIFRGGSKREKIKKVSSNRTPSNCSYKPSSNNKSTLAEPPPFFFHLPKYRYEHLNKSILTTICTVPIPKWQKYVCP